MGKKLFIFNFKDLCGKDFLKCFVVKVDVLVENFWFGVMDCFGFGYEML